MLGATVTEDLAMPIISRSRSVLRCISRCGWLVAGGLLAAVAVTRSEAAQEDQPPSVAARYHAAFEGGDREALAQFLSKSRFPYFTRHVLQYI